MSALACRATPPRWTIWPTIPDPKTWKWLSVGADIAALNAQFAPLGPEPMKIGRPLALYVTPAARDANGRLRLAADVPNDEGPPRAETAPHVISRRHLTDRLMTRAPFGRRRLTTAWLTFYNPPLAHGRRANIPPHPGNTGGFCLPVPI